MRSNVAKKHQEQKSASSPTKSASSPASRPYRIEEQVGDVQHTESDTTIARERLRYLPKVSLREGLERHVASIRAVGR